MGRDHSCPGCGRGGLNCRLDCICNDLALAFSAGWDSAWHHSGEGHNGEYVRSGEEATARIDAAHEAALAKFMEDFNEQA